MIVCEHTILYSSLMTNVEQVSRPPNSMRRAIAAKRDSDLRDRLLCAGASLLADSGLAGVSVQDVLATSEVFRATFYGFFANKTELATAILKPMFESGTDSLNRLTLRTPREAADGIIDVYLNLWDEHQGPLVLSTKIDEAVFSSIQSVHDTFNNKLKEALLVVEKGGLLRNDSANDTLLVLANTAIPLLRVYKNRPQLETLFRESILGLMLVDPT